MKARRGTVIDVDSLTEWERRMAHGVHSIGGWRLHGVDLSGHGDQVRTLEVSGATFIGCRMSEATEVALRQGGATVYDLPPDVPVDSFRSTLYTPDELYSGLLESGYEQTPDARAYAWSRLPENTESALAMTLHDHAIDTALAGWTRSRDLVGVMGGHGLVRGSADYAQAAALGHALADDFTVATGGGPGAMEAANLGAHVPRGGPLAEVLARVARVPSFRPRVDAWAEVALRAVRDLGPGRESLGIPTWFYGHEPPNPFATSIAKYFRNAQREAVLLQVCNAGIVFLPGAAGTVQEVFQDACENYYADESSVAPMILVGRRYWTETLPAWPLLRALAEGRGMSEHIHLVDEVAEVVSLLQPGGSA